MRWTLRTLTWAWVTTLAGLATAVVLHAGSLEPSAPPGPTMKTLNDIPPTWSQSLTANNGDPNTGCNSNRFRCVLGGSAVVDRETGLVWEKVAGVTATTWEVSILNCQSANTGGRMGWRLPTAAELTSLMDQSSGVPPAGSPFVNAANSAFWVMNTYPGDPTKSFFWSSRAAPGSLVSWNKGSVNADVWCVRGGTGFDGGH